MNKKISLPLLIAAVTLLLGGLCLALAFQLQMWAAGENCRKAAQQLQQLLPEKMAVTSAFCPDAPMPVLELEGEDYAALLEIPAFGLTLPVADRWQGDHFAAAPSRYWGSAYTDDLVIGGRDYPGQFDFCGKIELQTVVTLTDMTGRCFTYTVARVDRAAKAESQWLLDENFDLTLYCRGMFSTEYIAVRCVFSYK